ncbi:hypothetical protein DSO57_1031111 [Entomophthora muscae]|uniref:Uncharacterized protein n=1 Tax=Entomophthora muscae TaxID=34485 RepID=A0ACC2RRV0_9FUNG|nr:hypothetical protein DSO57_1031111 [Entomophthora muscae]
MFIEALAKSMQPGFNHGIDPFGRQLGQASCSVGKFHFKSCLISSKTPRPLAKFDLFTDP